MAFDDSSLDGYVDVAARMTEFFDKYPEGSLRPLNPAEPFKIVTIEGVLPARDASRSRGARPEQPMKTTYIVYTAAAYRHPGDPMPGVGSAMEPWPGRTPYTGDSELQNAETSAWGRAIAAVGAADTRRGVASRQEVRNRQADRDEWDDAAPVVGRGEPPADEKAQHTALINAGHREIAVAATHARLDELAAKLPGMRVAGQISETEMRTMQAAIMGRRAELDGNTSDGHINGKELVTT